MSPTFDSLTPAERAVYLDGYARAIRQSCVLSAATIGAYIAGTGEQPEPDMVAYPGAFASAGETIELFSDGSARHVTHYAPVREVAA